jgi:hypothetical protein
MVSTVDSEYWSHAQGGSLLQLWRDGRVRVVGSCCWDARAPDRRHYKITQGELGLHL